MQVALRCLSPCSTYDETCSSSLPLLLVLFWPLLGRRWLCAQPSPAWWPRVIPTALCGSRHRGKQGTESLRGPGERGRLWPYGRGCAAEIQAAWDSSGGEFSAKAQKRKGRKRLPCSGFPVRRDQLEERAPKTVSGGVAGHKNNVRE